MATTADASVQTAWEDRDTGLGSNEVGTISHSPVGSATHVSSPTPARGIAATTRTQTKQTVAVRSDGGGAYGTSAVATAVPRRPGITYLGTRHQCRIKSTQLGIHWL